MNYKKAYKAADAGKLVRPCGHVGSIEMTDDVWFRLEGDNWYDLQNKVHYFVPSAYTQNTWEVKGEVEELIIKDSNDASIFSFLDHFVAHSNITFETAHKLLQQEYNKKHITTSLTVGEIIKYKVTMQYIEAREILKQRKENDD